MLVELADAFQISNGINSIHRQSESIDARKERYRSAYHVFLDHSQPTELIDEDLSIGIRPKTKHGQPGSIISTLVDKTKIVSHSRSFAIPARDVLCSLTCLDEGEVIIGHIDILRGLFHSHLCHQSKIVRQRRITEEKVRRYPTAIVHVVKSTGNTASGPDATLSKENRRLLIVNG